MLREMQVRTMVRFQFNPVRVSIIQEPALWCNRKSCYLQLWRPTWAPVPVPATPLPIQLLTNGLGKEQKVAQVDVSPNLESQIQILTLPFNSCVSMAKSLGEYTILQTSFYLRSQVVLINILRFDAFFIHKKHGAVKCLLT